MTYTLDDLANLGPGTEITLHLSDGSVLGATHDAVMTVPQKQYDTLWNRIRMRLLDTRPLPRISDTLSVELDNSRYRGTFSGIMMGNLLLADLARAGDTLQLPLSQITHLESGRGDSLSAGQLMSLAQAGLIPTMVRLRVLVKGQPTLIPSEKVRLISHTESGNARWIGLGIGAAVDVTIILYTIALNEAFSDATGGCRNSTQRR
jgi:hypothetical protein